MLLLNMSIEWVHNQLSYFVVFGILLQQYLLLEALQIEVEYYKHMAFLALAQSARRRCIDFYNKPCIELKPEYVIQPLIKMYRPTHNPI